MRTTVSISDELLAAAKLEARKKGLTLGQIMEAAPRRELLSNDPPARRKVPVFRDGTGPHPEIELNSNSSLQETLEEELDLNQLR